MPNDSHDLLKFGGVVGCEYDILISFVYVFFLLFVFRQYILFLSFRTPHLSLWTSIELHLMYF